MDIIKMIHSDYVYSRGYRGKIKRVVLVFIFGFFSLIFFSVAEAGIKESLKQRGVLVYCNNSLSGYSEKLLKRPKFVSLKFRQAAECDIIKNQIGSGKKKLSQAIKAHSKDARSKYLLLQIEFEESVLKKAASDSERVEINMELFEDLIKLIKDDWPASDFEEDPYYYIQEIGSILTPYTLTLLYDFHSANSIDKEDSKSQVTFLEMFEIIGDKDGCLDILTNVHNKIIQHKNKYASEKVKPINDSSYEIYLSQSELIKNDLCGRLDNLRQVIDSYDEGVL